MSRSSSGKPFEVQFDIIGLPKMTNGLMVHWRTKHAEAKKWKTAVIRILSVLVGDPPYLKKARVELTRFSSSEPDFDGLVSGFKHVVDGLVVFGLIINDKQSTIGQPVYKWEKAKAGQGKIRIKVTEA